MRNRLKGVSLAAAIGMGIVLLMGTLVTKTGSAEGCGTDWPLCNGKFIPAYTIESMIEYSHRFVTGVVGVLVVATAWLVHKYLRSNKEAKLFAYGTLFFTILQAILGAFAVMWPQSDAVMALHFGFSLLAFSTSLLLVIGLRNGHYIPDGEAQTERNIPRYKPILHKMVWFSLVYCYAVVYVGAFVRHTESSGGCLGWPLCNGALIPELTGAQGIAFVHRVAAALLLVVIICLLVLAKQVRHEAPLMWATAKWAFALVLLQIFSGATVIWTLTDENWYLLTALVHGLLISGLFAVLCYMALLSWRSMRHEKRSGRL